MSLRIDAPTSTYEVLGISPDAGPRVAAKRLVTLWNQLDRASRAFEQTYGGDPDRPGGPDPQK